MVVLEQRTKCLVWGQEGGGGVGWTTPPTPQTKIKSTGMKNVKRYIFYFQKMSLILKDTFWKLSIKN